MKRGTCIVIVLLVAIVGSWSFLGCINPPKDTVYFRDSDGSIAGLAWDKDADGVADLIPATKPKIGEDGEPVLNAAGQPVMELILDAEGQPVFVPHVIPGSDIYRTGEKIDAVTPGLLGGIGAFLPGGIGAVLIGLGAAWKTGRFGRIVSNTVMSIQQARQRLKDGGYSEALALLDEALKSGQVQATVDQIKKIKAQLGVASVTDSAG
jgi:hypothetical protein